MEEKTITIYDIAKKLDSVGLQFMATVGSDKKPKVRPVQYMVTFEQKLWFCTNSAKSLYAELAECPYIELCASKLEKEEINTSWIRFSAEVVFEENKEVKEAIMKKSSIVHELYNNDIDHPLFKVFYLKNIRGSMNNLGHVKGLEDRKDFAPAIEFSL